MSHTLTIWDWDDTLLPNYWLVTSGLLKEYDVPLPEDAKRHLREISESVLAVLQQAQTHGLVMIITNGDVGWVEVSCRLFFPTLAQFIDTIPIISARASYELYSSDPHVWKRMAFAAECGLSTNIISIGDSDSERYAVNCLKAPGRTVKSLKLEIRPSLETFKAQLTTVSRILSGIILHPGDMDIACNTDILKPVHGESLVP